MRAAGNDSHYVWQLKGREGQCDIRLPSVTSIIKTVMGGSGPGMAWWGARQAVEWAFAEYGPGRWGNHPDEIPAPVPDDWYNEYKKSRYNPNAQRDKAGDRGTKAHDILEALATGSQPQDIMCSNGYEEAVLKWWEEQMPGWQVVTAETPVYSLKHAYAGTVDLVRKLKGNYSCEVVDLKTHKPPARFEDHLQVAAYDLALQEMGVTGRLFESAHSIVLAKEDGTFEESDRWVDPTLFVKIREIYEEVK